MFHHCSASRRAGSARRRSSRRSRPEISIGALHGPAVLFRHRPQFLTDRREPLVGRHRLMLINARLGWQGVAVELWVTVRRFRCRNSSCPRKIFCERLPHVTRVYGRQTERASEIVRLIGYISGGLPGQRLLARLSISTSDDTVLRRVRQEPAQAPSSAAVRNLGVDDWAWHKGQEYGTILVDLDLHRVVDLLPDRAAESFSEWLQTDSDQSLYALDEEGRVWGLLPLAADPAPEPEKEQNTATMNKLTIAEQYAQHAAASDEENPMESFAAKIEANFHLMTQEECDEAIAFFQADAEENLG